MDFVIKMAYTAGTQIFQKTYELIKTVFEYTQGFPKSQRFVLGQRIENLTINVLDGIILANEGRNKAAILIKASVELEKIRVFTRLAKDLRFLDFEKYEFLSQQINEIGKMLGGWIKYSKNNEKT